MLNNVAPYSQVEIPIGTNYVRVIYIQDLFNPQNFGAVHCDGLVYPFTANAGTIIAKCKANFNYSNLQMVVDGNDTVEHYQTVELNMKKIAVSFHSAYPEIMPQIKQKF